MRYDRAREIKSHRGVDELRKLADSLPENALAEQVALRKLQIDTRKWIISKILPKFADNHRPEVHVNNTVNNNLVMTTERAKELQERRLRLLGGDKD